MILFFLLLRIIYVPADSATPQKGMNGLTTGDTVEMATGTYNIGDLYMPKNMQFTVRGEGIATDVILDAQGGNNVIDMRNTPGANGSDTLFIEDLTLYRGKASQGGGLLWYQQMKATVRRCIFKGDTASGGSGGAIVFILPYDQSNNPLIVENCWFDSCYTSGGYDNGSVIGNYGGNVNYVYNSTFTNIKRGAYRGTIIGTLAPHQGSMTIKFKNNIIWNCGNGDSLFEGSVSHAQDTCWNCDFDLTGTLWTTTKNCLDDQDPLLTGYELGAGSPCIGTGYDVSGILTENKDIEGTTWTIPYSMGCYWHSIPTGGGQSKIVINIF
jgi:hypothetical protein